MKKKQQEFTLKEAKQRFEAALRGSRLVGPRPPRTVIVKRGRPPQDKKDGNGQT